MSLILEALRKSETERRRAQAPDLFAPAQVAVAPARRLPPPWLVGGGALVLLVAALLLVRAFWPASQHRVLAEAPPLAHPPAVPAPRPTASTPVPTDSGAPAPATPGLSSPSSTVPAPGPVAAADAPRPVPARQADEPEVAVAAASDDRRDTAPAPSLEPAPAPPPAAREPASPPAPEATPALARLSELDGDARRQLPPLKLSMHMWNEAADRRFVILDGRRLAEGDRIGAVRVAEIRRDGVVLDWNGQRLELSLR